MKNISYLIILFCIGCQVRVFEGKARDQEAWDAENSPVHFNKSYTYELAKLSTQGQLDTAPWSDSYWPKCFGGIAARWQSLPFPVDIGKTFCSDNKAQYSFEAPTPAALKNMSRDQIALLSPAEKLDLLRGDTSFKFFKSVRNSNLQDAPWWHGLCHGWAPVSLRFKEPNPVILKNPQGIEVPFASSDVKALLTYWEGNITKAKTLLVGQRCINKIDEDPELAKTPECRDTNAGSFHVILANEIGKAKQGILADLKRNNEVFHFPIYKFESQQIGEPKKGASPGAAKGTKMEVTFETTIHYAMYAAPHVEARIAKKNNLTSSTKYRYRVELDGKGKVIGGEWETQDRPDFLWKAMSAPFEGEWDILNTIYKASTNTL